VLKASLNTLSTKLSHNSLTNLTELRCKKSAELNPNYKNHGQP
jgi:hypothetical protein